MTSGLVIKLSEGDFSAVRKATVIFGIYGRPEVGA